MPVKKEPGTEPIPGYKLIERLGGGGFGEVWKASAPGGLLKAMKFVYGDLLAAEGSDEDSRARQEKTALERIKSVRHPYILSLERVDEIEGELIITTELADRTIWDRFKECRTEEKDPKPGIPRGELLGYMEEIADALDFMYQKYKLQHLDIKPQNIFLVSDHVKVADFGLVNALGDRGAATVTGGVTPVYAAPETFDGEFSPFSDQYSLAIVFMELLTGQRPFSGSTIRQLIMQHIKGEKDLSPLTLADRRVVERALKREYKERYPNCKEFVRALRGGRPVIATEGVVTETPVPSTVLSPVEETPRPVQGEVGNTEATRDVRKWSSTPSEGEIDLAAGVPATAFPEPTGEPSSASPRGTEAVLDTPVEEPSTSSRTVLGRRSSEVPKPASPGSGAIQPALVLGLGGFGLMTLRRLRYWLTSEVAAPTALPWIRLLGLDTDERFGQESQGDKAVLSAAELASVPLQRAGHYLKGREGKEALESWLSSKSLYHIPRQRHGAVVRSLGRLAFLDNFRNLTRRIEAELQACLAVSDNASSNDLRSNQPRVYLAAHLGGNTGSGMFLDAAYVVRNMLRRFGFLQGEVVGLLFVPTPSKEGSCSPALANGFAALSELDSFASGRVPFTARYEGEDGKPKTFTEVGSPFHRCYLVPVPEPVGSTPVPVPSDLERAAEFLYRDLATPLGQAADRVRQSVAALPGPAGSFQFRTFGLHRICWPRQRLLEQASFRLCRRLVDRWMAKKADPAPADLPHQVEERWEALQLRPEGVITRLQEMAAEGLGRVPESLFQEILQPLRSAGRSESGLDIGPVTKVLQRFEELLGMPEEFVTPTAGGQEAGEIERLLEGVSRKLVDRYENRLNVEIARLIEQPDYRLAGAEEALKCYARLLEKHLQTQEQLFKEVRERCVVLLQRALEILENPVANPQVTTSIWKAFARKPQASQDDPATVLLHLLESYPRSRFQCLVLQHVNALYVSLRGLISDQVREIGFCRTRLVELQGLLQEKTTEDGSARSTAHLLLPGNSRSAEDVVKQMDQAVSGSDLLDFDRQAQGLLGAEFKGLVEVCMGPPNVVRTLAPNLVELGRRFLQDRLPAASVAEMFRAHPHAAGQDDAAPDAAEVDDADLRGALKTADRLAAPPWDRPGSREISLVSLPEDAAGRHLQSLLREVVPDAIVVPATRSDEMVFLRERLEAFPGSSADFRAAEEAYRQRLAADPETLHSRKDIAFTPVQTPRP